MPYGHFAPQRTLKKEIHSLKPVYSQTSVIKGKPKKLKNNKPQNFLEHSKIKKRTTEQHNHRIQTWTIRGNSEEITSAFIGDSDTCRTIKCFSFTSPYFLGLTNQTPLKKQPNSPKKTKNQDIDVISSWNKKNELYPLLLSLTNRD